VAFLISPILLSMDEENWGPRPRRMLKCWADLPGYRQFVRDNLQSYHIEGWGGYVLKEKLKLIKGSLNNWHQNHTQNLEGRKMIYKNVFLFLMLKGSKLIFYWRKLRNYTLFQQICIHYLASTPACNGRNPDYFG